MKSSYFFYQDSIIGARSDAVVPTPLTTDSASGIRKFSTTEADDIFLAMEKRERKMDSIARVRAYYAYIRSLEEQQPEGFDTAAVPYNFSIDSIHPLNNPLQHFNKSYFSSRDSSMPVFIERAETIEIQAEPIIKPGQNNTHGTSHELRPDWLLVIIIGSLVILAWLKLFYDKFLDQTLQSVANYQLSAKLLRDQNIFSKRVAFVLNINFIFIGAAFIYLILGYFNVRVLYLGDFYSYLCYAGFLALILMLRFIVSRLIGHVFNKKNEFRDYLHQLLLIYKSLGICLLVPVIGIAYIREDLRIYLIYIAGFIIFASFMFRLAKGVKILLINKEALIFYLILYLCMLEILPLMIFYRVFSLSIIAG